MSCKVLIFLSLAAIARSSPVPEREGRIVGGTNAALGQYPYQVTIRRVERNQHFCGGSIINTRWLLTAAHCTIQFTPAQLQIIVGTVLLNSGGVTHQVSRIVNHPSWNDNTWANDVAVVQTATVITFNANVQPIILGSAHVGGGVSAVVTGFGLTQAFGSLAENLQRLTTTTLTNTDCRSRFTAALRDRVFDHKICTFIRIGQGICSSDSGTKKIISINSSTYNILNFIGGPLVADRQQIGIVSWGMIQCASGLPEVYDRVAFFRTWILNSIA